MNSGEICGILRHFRLGDMTCSGLAPSPASVIREDKFGTCAKELWAWNLYVLGERIVVVFGCGIYTWHGSSPQDFETPAQRFRAHHRCDFQYEGSVFLPRLISRSTLVRSENTGQGLLCCLLNI